MRNLITFALAVLFLISGLVYFITGNHTLRPNREIHGWYTEKKIETQ